MTELVIRGKISYPLRIPDSEDTRQLNSKIKNLFQAENTGERIFSLLEIKWNLLFNSTPVSLESSSDFGKFLLRLKENEPVLSKLKNLALKNEKLIKKLKEYEKI